VGAAVAIRWSQLRVAARLISSSASARSATLKVGLACASLVSGCGGSAPRRDPAREARVVAETNAFCQHVSTLPPVSRRSEQQIRAIQARFAALAKAVSMTAAYLPAGRDLNKAHAERRAVYADASKRFRAGLARPANFDYRAGRIQLRIYRDELTLGLTCNGQVALAARETEHVLAAAGR
jgi:hypothetical protein